MASNPWKIGMFTITPALKNPPQSFWNPFLILGLVTEYEAIKAIFGIMSALATLTFPS